MPAPSIRAPFTRRASPTKNQIEMAFSASISSPENDIQNYENNPNNRSPERWALEYRRAFLLRDVRHAVNQTIQFLNRFRLCEQADGDGDHHANDPRPKSAINIRSERTSVNGKRQITHGGRVLPFPAEHAGGGQSANQQAPKSAFAGGALPKHSENNRSEKRGDENTKESLHVIHDAEKLHYEVCRADADKHAKNCAPAAHVHVVLVRGMLLDQRAVNVVGPHGRESAHVSSHARHESRNQRC